jgi:hypothetical protein
MTLLIQRPLGEQGFSLPSQEVPGNLYVPADVGFSSKANMYKEK